METKSNPQCPDALESIRAATLFPNRKSLLIGEVARALAVSVEHAIDLVDEGCLRVLNRRKGVKQRQWRVSITSYEAFLASRRATGCAVVEPSQKDALYSALGHLRPTLTSVEAVEVLNCSGGVVRSRIRNGGLTAFDLSTEPGRCKAVYRILRRDVLHLLRPEREPRAESSRDIDSLISADRTELRVADMADFLSVNKGRVQELCRANVIPAKNMGSAYAITREAFLGFLESRLIQPQIRRLYRSAMEWRGERK